MVAVTLLCAIVCPPWAVAPRICRDESCACTLSHHELAIYHALRKCAPDEGKLAVTSGDFTVDIGLHKPESILVDRQGLEMLVGRDRGMIRIPWRFLSKVAKKRRVGVWECWRVGTADAAAHADTAVECDEEEELPIRVEGFSELTQRSASLLPLDGAVPPTAVLGGFSMHRMKDISPGQDTERKLGALGSKVRGSVLDICTGLGYTAIGAAAKPSVDNVFTIELDPLMVRGIAHAGIRHDTPSCPVAWQSLRCAVVGGATARKPMV